MRYIINATDRSTHAVNQGTLVYNYLRQEMMLYSNNVVPLHIPITTIMRERSRSQTVVKNYRHQLRHHPESEMNQRTPNFFSVIGPPYGDDPHDQYWIDQGYQFK